MEMKYTAIFLPLLFLLLSTCTPDRQDQSEVEKMPINVVFILADDLGYGDLGCYGQERIHTPYIDRMAANGMKFTDFYAGNTVCAPSRCALMTGKHMGHAFIRGNSLEPLRETDSTLAQLFKKRGYKTGMFGKWGLGEFGSTGTPEKKGFDQFKGFLNQMDAHKYYFDSMDVIVEGAMQRIAIDSNRYTHDIIMEAAFDFVQNNRDHPFFLYLPVTLPHAELLLPEEDIQPYLDANGNSIFEETPFEGNWLYRPQKMPKAAYAGMVTRLDHDVGKLLDLLDRLGLHDRTIVFFTSDNGPHAEGGLDPNDFDSNGPLRGFKRDLYEGGIRVPMIVRGPGVPAGTVNDNPGAFWDMLATFARMMNLKVNYSHDGVSLWSTIHEPEMVVDHPFLYWEHYVSWEKKFSQAIRKDEWKALRIGVAGEPVRLELYDLNTDLGEQENLASRYPEKMNVMIQLMDSASTPPENETFIYSKNFFND
jgi:arylsulfatase A-like enzyme